MALVGERDRAAEQARVAEETILELRGTCDGMQAELHRVGREAGHLRERLAESERVAAKLAESATAEREALSAEVARLNGLLEQIYRSKTWKLHELIERLRARLGLR